MQFDANAGNQIAIRIVGMSRSGNHAIINWILNQIDSPWVFLNCVEPKTNPFHSARPLDCGNSIIASGRAMPEAGEDRMRAFAEYLVFSQEDTFLQPALGGSASEMQGVSQQGVDVIILRDPYNLMASRKQFDWSFVTPLTERRIWKQHAKRVLSRKGFGGRKLVPIIYNCWVSDTAYRRSIASQLGLSFSDSGWDETASCGGGSSFEGYAHSKEGVFERWRLFAREADFWERIDPEMEALAEAIFGMNHPLREEAEAA